MGSYNLFTTRKCPGNEFTGMVRQGCTSENIYIRKWGTWDTDKQRAIYDGSYIQLYNDLGKDIVLEMYKHGSECSNTETPAHPVI